MVLPPTSRWAVTSPVQRPVSYDVNGDGRRTQLTGRDDWSKAVLHA
ncbi:hypothetical protein OG568_51115 (plasmid) [Streptomyces sp. NBC_01450]|nr:hypothetical protein [Streptomyces sp. NBC_01450]